MKNRFLILVIGLVALLAFQAKVIMPIVYDVVASGLFLEDSGDDPNRISNNTAMTDRAFEQCNIYIANEIMPDQTLSYKKEPTSAFSLGNFEYVISANIEILPPNDASYSKSYACKIKYLNKDDITEIANADNWSISGISGLNN